MDDRGDQPTPLDPPTVSIVIPCHIDGPDLRACLAAVARLDPAPDEVVVAVDGGDPALCAVVGDHADVVVPVVPQAGPAVARNLGARHARGDVLWFVDADVEVHPDGVARVRQDLADPTVTGVIGSYDDRPPVTTLAAHYKNLRNHHVHHEAAGDGRTFWGACGAVRRDAFLAVGGFDGDTYPHPSIEDIELGYRLTDAGHRLRVDPRLQVTHRKDWTLRKLVTTDVTRRALPWSELLLARGGFEDELDVAPSARTAVALSWLAVASVAAPVRRLRARLGAATACLVAVAWLDRRLLRTLATVRGGAFAASSFPLHVLTHLYAGATFVVATVRHVTGTAQVPQAPRPALTPVAPDPAERTTT